MSSKIKELVNSYNASFYNHATTNAYLITEEMINKFETVDLKSFQITIDGDEKSITQLEMKRVNPLFKE